MKAFILITRTYDNEFGKYSNNISTQLLVPPVLSIDNELDFLIINGYLLNGIDIPILEDIKNISVISDANTAIKLFSETLIAIHTNLDFDLVKQSLKNSFNDKKKWGQLIIKKYSSGGNELSSPIYLQNLLPLGNALKANPRNDEDIKQKVKTLFEFFFTDPVYQAKNTLLEKCYDPENLPELDPLLSDYADAYRSFKEMIQGENLYGADRIYINALEKLRDDLNLKI